MDGAKSATKSAYAGVKEVPSKDLVDEPAKPDPKAQEQLKPRLTKILDSLRKQKRRGNLGTLQSCGTIDYTEIPEESQISDDQEPGTKRDKMYTSSHEKLTVTALGIDRTKASEKTRKSNRPVKSDKTQVLPVGSNQLSPVQVESSRASIPPVASLSPRNKDNKVKQSSESGTGTARTSSSRKKLQKRMLAAFRKKESQKRPVNLDDIIETYSQPPEGQGEKTNVKALKQRQQEKFKRERTIILWMSRISVFILFLCILVSAKGFLSLIGREWEIERLETVLRERGTNWTSPFCRHFMYRTYEVSKNSNRSEVLSCESVVTPISKSKWTSWSTCINGEKRRWRLLLKGKTYEKDAEIEQIEKCVIASTTLLQTTTTSVQTTTTSVQTTTTSSAPNINTTSLQSSN